MNILRSTIINFVSTVLIFIGAFLSNVLIIKLIGAEGKGLIANFVAFFGLISGISYLSLGAGLIYRSNQNTAFTKYFNSAIVYSIINGLLVSLLLIIFKPLILTHVLKNIPVSYFNLGVVFIVFDTLGKAAIAATRTNKKVRIYNISLILNTLIPFLIIFILWFFSVKIEPLTIIVITYMGAFMLLTYIFFSFSKQINLRLANFTAIKEMLAYGIREHIGLVAQKINLRLDIVIMGMILSADMIGYYSIAVLFAELMWYLPNAIGVFLFPVISSNKNIKESYKKVTSIHRISMVLLLILSIFLFLFVEYPIVFLFGSDFIITVQVVKLLLIGTLSLSSAKIITKYFSGIGKPFINSKATILGAIFNVLGLSILLPIYGIVGAAIATSISYTVIALYLIFTFLNQSNNKITLKDLFIPSNEDIKLIKLKFLNI
jgi:O-antigen/teichoic acid export membrane protein